jgi:hypothetical protein
MGLKVCYIMVVIVNGNDNRPSLVFVRSTMLSSCDSSTTFHPSVTVVQLATESSYWRKNTTFEQWQGELERCSITNGQLDTCESTQFGEL